MDNTITDNMQLIQNIPVEITVEIGRRVISIKDLAEINIGSLIELNKIAGEKCDIYANGKQIGTGDVIVINEKFGIRITTLSNYTDTKSYVTRDAIVE